MDTFDDDSTAAAMPFDALNQTFTIYDQYGTESAFPLPIMTSWLRYGIIQCIIQAAQIGACLAVLLLLLVLTKPEKRRLPVFALNVLALIFTITAQILACLYYTSSWYTPYAAFTGDYGFVTPSAKAVAIASPMFTLLVLVALEASLVLQVHVVCITLTRLTRDLVTSLSTIMALVPVGFRVAQTIENVTWNIIKQETNDDAAWLVQARDISLAVSICFFSAVFCGKLGWSILERRKLGMGTQGAMQIIFVGGCQTMIIPAIFAILQFAIPTIHIDTMILTFTVLSLPLTSLWASAATANPSSQSSGAPKRFLLPTSSFRSTSKMGLFSGLSSFPSFKGASRATPQHSRDEQSQGLAKNIEVRGSEASDGDKYGLRSPDRDLEMQGLKV